MMNMNRVPPPLRETDVQRQEPVAATSQHTPASRKSWLRRRDARPSEILEAALGEFSRKGFSAARMEDIARLAGISKGTIYLYYKNKEGLFRTLVHETIGKGLTVAADRAASSRKTSRKRLADFLSEVAAFFSGHGHSVLLKIILSESGNFPELARLYRVEVIDRITDTLSDIIADTAEQSGRYRLPAEQIAQLCVAPVLLSILWRSSFEQSNEAAHDERAVVAAQLDIILRGCLVGDDGVDCATPGEPYEEGCG